ncbi:hypothetical protein EVG80_15105 [Salmonella enterica subsp. enterica serovar Mississippi]|nr:hypothetical protein [Salmonella enterica subsp. enterica serovar Mississippi]
MRDAVTIDLLHGQITRAKDTAPIRRIAIPVELERATIGAHPSIEVSGATMGFDWDSGTLFINPVKPLTPLSHEDLASIKLARKEGQSYAMQKAHERWNSERGDLVDIIHKLRAALLQKGMSTADLENLAGAAPTGNYKRRSA